MDSEDDIYSDGDYFEQDYSDFDEDEQGYDDDSIEPTSPSHKSYKVLSEDDVRKRQEDDITNVSSVLSVSRVSATILLCYHNWIASNVHEAWFSDEEKVRSTVGLFRTPLAFYPFSTKLTCRICFRNIRRGKMYAAACGHPFCKSCWKSYISIAIKDGPGSLMLRCPDPLCRAAVGQDMTNLFVSDEDKKKFSRYLLRSYVEVSNTTKWCPAPDCSYAIEFAVGSGCYDVSCNCTYTFCWNCTQEIHRPVDCATVAKWILKNCAEAENTNWIIVNTKPCPKCKRSIEKNQGCMHMTCTPPCKFEFCWLCLGTWSEHNDVTGGYTACNRYEKSKQEGVYKIDEGRREMAKQALERYTHHYERWASNESSRKKAIADLQQMQVLHIKKLSTVQCELESQLKFIIDAWEQIIECRRVLRWTYAYGYYVPEHAKAKTEFFEYLQGVAESWLERLHQCAEKDLQIYLMAKEPSENFDEFRAKLVDLTIVTRNYFENLGRALENDLADVESHGSCRGTETGIQIPTSESERKPSGEATTRVANSPGRLMDEEEEYGLGNSFFAAILNSDG